MCMFSELARDYTQLCGLCGYLCFNKVIHRLCFCNKLKAKREILWNLLITKYGYRYVIAYSKNAPLIQCEYCAVPVYINRNCLTLDVCNVLVKMFNARCLQVKLVEYIEYVMAYIVICVCSLALSVYIMKHIIEL